MIEIPQLQTTFLKQKLKVCCLDKRVENSDIISQFGMQLQNFKFKNNNSKFKIQNSIFKNQHKKFEVQNSRFKMTIEK